jgi:uncharacterized protein
MRAIEASMRFGAIFCFAMLALFAGLSFASAEGPLTPLTMQTKAGPVRFEVETAKTAEERQVGLMYRRALADDRGMLFDFGSDTDVIMWMKNTFIPLDMVFIRSDGVVHRVESNTTPFSEALIPAGAPVRYVVELAAGVAAKRGIARGDRVDHALIESQKGEAQKSGAQ